MSWLFASFVLGLGLLLAWVVTHFGRKYGEPEKKLRALRWLLVVGGLAAAVFVYLTDSHQRGTTLFEVVLEGPTGADLVAGESIEYSVQVEHPGVEHELTLAPKPRFGAEAPGAVSMHVTLENPTQQTLIDTTHEFARVRQTTSNRGVPIVRMVWDSNTWRFTPTEVGSYVLTLTPQVAMPTVLVRVTDPEKTDGKRAPGY